MERTITTLTAVALLATAIVPGLVAANHGTSQTKPYLGPAAGAHVVECNEDTGIGGVTFCELGHAESINLTVEDDAGLPVPVLTQVRTSDGSALVTEVFCGEIVDVPIPADATEVDVWVGHTNALVFGALIGEVPTCPGPATQGTVTATFGGPVD